MYKFTATGRFYGLTYLIKTLREMLIVYKSWNICTNLIEERGWYLPRAILYACYMSFPNILQLNGWIIY